MPAEIFIDDVIGSDFFGMGITARDIRDQLKDVDEEEPVLLRINSPGGNVFDAVDILSNLVDHKGRIDTRIDGLAASAASYIAMIGKRITMASGSRFMYHDPWTVIAGNWRELEKEASVLKSIGNDLAEAYSRRSGQTVKAVLAAMEAETWLSPAEAIEQGFADEELQTVQAKACTIPLNFEYKNAPREQLGEQLKLRDKKNNLGRFAPAAMRRQLDLVAARIKSA